MPIESYILDDKGSVIAHLNFDNSTVKLANDEVSFGDMIKITTNILEGELYWNKEKYPMIKIKNYDTQKKNKDNM